MNLSYTVSAIISQIMFLVNAFYTPKMKSEFQQTRSGYKQYLNCEPGRDKQDLTVNSSTSMQSLRLITVEKQWKHIAYLIHSSHAA